MVEKIRLLQIEGMTALRQDDQSGLRDMSFHEDVGLNARFILIADQQERGYLKLSELGFKFKDGGTLQLQSLKGQCGSDCRVICELVPKFLQPLESFRRN